MSLIGDRIINLREKMNINQRELALKLKISPSVMNRIESGERPIRDDEIKNIATFFNVSTDYLLGNNDKYLLKNQVPLPLDNKKIPVIGTVRCGPGGLAFEYIDEYVGVDDNLSGNIIAFRCKGDSMIGLGISEGDIAIVRQQETVENGELAIVVINGDEGTLKRVRFQENMIILEAANPIYEPRFFSGEELNIVKIVGKVLEVRKRF